MSHTFTAEQQAELAKNKLDTEILREAIAIYWHLKDLGHDYFKHIAQIAKEGFEDGIYNGNWDVTINFDDGTRSLRLIQEDEYDQHMGEDEDKPTWDSMLFQAGAYVWFADSTS